MLVRPSTVIGAFASLGVVAALAVLPGCAAGAGDDEDVAGDENAVSVDTRSPEARRQYDANVAFATSYAARCARSSSSSRPRVLVTGFGRFMSIADNATGRVVAKLLPSVKYPETQPPASGEVDDPAPQLSVGTETLDLPGVGEVDVCGMILPVYWDLAAVLIAKEVDAFQPSFVLMNGVAGETQPLWIELGATNKAAPLDDGSNQLRPALKAGEAFAPIVPGGDVARPNRLSWDSVLHAVSTTLEAHAEDVEDETRFADVMPGVKLAGFPRESNTYLCNNVTYATGWLMGHPKKTAHLMRATPAIKGKINQVDVKLQHDLSYSARVFMHWPSVMATKFHAQGAEIMKAVIATQIAQLDGSPDREPPTFGDNGRADPTLQGGDTF